MKTRLLSGAVLALLALVSITAASPAAVDLVGTWLGKAEVPDAGIVEMTFVVSKTETGYTGVIISDSMGLITPNTAVADIKLAGNELTFNFPLADGAKIDNLLKIEGDKMTGTWTHPEGDSGPLSFERKK
jgi:hypothetical protein